MTRPDHFEIDFEPVGKRVDVPAGSDLLDAARQAGIGLASVCGGEGTCGRCRVVIMNGKVSEPVDADRRFLSQLEINAGHRLACRVHVHSDVKVHVPKASLVTDQRLQVGGLARALTVENTIKACAVETDPPTLRDLRSDLGRVTDAIESAYGLRHLAVEPSVIRQLSPTARTHNWNLTAFIHGREIVGFAAPARRPVGFAVDLGTTKIAGFLVDLETGAELAAGGVMNPQISYGEDVISRLVYAGRGPAAAAEIRGVVIEGLNGLVATLCEQAGIERTEVAEACIVGNTAMHHLLLGLPTQQLSVAPFVAAASDAVDVRARDLGLELAPGAYVHVPPCIGGFVGADHVAMILASDLDKGDRVAVGVDIGTNTEIALCKPGLAYLTSASCASGPAFEGAHIRDGMRAASGAIEAVRITADGPQIKTIGDAPAVGICGSGIVDAIAALHGAGLLNDRGRLQKDAPGLRMGTQGPEYPLALAPNTGTGRDVVITQSDVNEIQLAKGAIQAGLEILLESTGTPAEAVDEMIVAGAFGSFLNLESALDIGLLPRLPRARYAQVGNAAGVGAKALLLSLKERTRAQKIASRTSYIELTTYPGFQKRFALSMWFPAAHRRVREDA
ncbi:MAG TPA: ASKHA domain-containing protein [Anaerolineales bacterium]|nr:ASKHA domain-containing protein [Anaerolineales bacterium]